MKPTYIEYSVSHGSGTLIEHGIFTTNGIVLNGERRVFPSAKLLVQDYEIDAARYQEFLGIHGSERAI